MPFKRQFRDKYTDRAPERILCLNSVRLVFSMSGTRGFQPKNAGTNWGWHKFMSHDSLFDASKAFLHDDKLVVKSDVSMLASVTATAGVIPAPPSTLAADLATIQFGEWKFVNLS